MIGHSDNHATVTAYVTTPGGALQVGCSQDPSCTTLMNGHKLPAGNYLLVMHLNSDGSVDSSPAFRRNKYANR